MGPNAGMLFQTGHMRRTLSQMTTCGALLATSNGRNLLELYKKANRKDNPKRVSPGFA